MVCSSLPNSLTWPTVIISKRAQRNTKAQGPNTVKHQRTEELEVNWPVLLFLASRLFSTPFCRVLELFKSFRRQGLFSVKYSDRQNHSFLNKIHPAWQAYGENKGAYMETSPSFRFLEKARRLRIRGALGHCTDGLNTQNDAERERRLESSFHLLELLTISFLSFCVFFHDCIQSFLFKSGTTKD